MRSISVKEVVGDGPKLKSSYSSQGASERSNISERRYLPPYPRMECCYSPARSTEGAGDDPEITLPSETLPNASDLKAVTRARIKDVCRTKPGLKAILSEENIELLLEGIRGNYKNLEAKITEINACDTKGKVQNVINNTSADMNLVQRNRVKTLDALLSSGQAQVLNELLVWVAGLSYQPSTKLLESVLFLTSGEEFLLADQITTTYSPVLSISKEGRVGFKDGLRDILSASGTSDSESALTQLHHEAISAAEVNLCRRFIKNACDPTDYARFRFADFFDAMEQKVHIHLDDDNSVNVTIIDLCVRSLFDSRKDENLDELRDYAATWFYWHLKSLVEALDNYEPSRKFMNDTGAQLVDLFYDSCMIDSWFVQKHLWWLKSDFLNQDFFIDPLLKFLKNPQVAKGCARDAKKSSWVKSVVSNTANKYSVLERIAARLASHWFSCSNGTMDTDFLWIPYGVFVKLSKPDEPFNETNPTLVELDKFICWAKEHIDIDPDSFTWDLRVGATHIVFQHYKEAIVRLNKVEKHFQNNWGLFYNLASAHASDKNHCSALKYIQDFKSLSDRFFGTDKTYEFVYYELLLLEGNCHRQRHDYDLAVKSFQDLLGRDIDEDSGMTWLYLDALSGLFTIWSETKSYESIMDFVRSWKDATVRNRGPTHWLRRAAYNDVSHMSIIVAAKNTGAVEEVLSLYQEAIDHKPLDSSTMDQQEINVSAEATEQLQYFQAVLRFHGSNSSHDQHRSIQYWEEMIQRSDANPALYSTAHTASRKLAPTLLDMAVAEISTTPSSSSESYVSRLEKFANLNTRLVCNLHQGYLDPRLCLARLYFLMNDHTSAFKQAQARLRSVFDKWPEATDDNSLSLRFSNLAQTLTVLDADTDAVAAWQAIEPYQPSQVSVADADTSSAGNASAEASHTNIIPASQARESEDGPDTSSSTKPKAKGYISGYICDGGCRTRWKNVLADCYVCKHCLCVQFCSACYKKLLAGELHPLICNKDHKMLFLPWFDWDAWHAMPVDMMTVNKQSVPRREWIDRIRKEYDVQQEQIDMTKLEKARELKAASVIAVRWRSRLKRIRDKNPSTAPTLRRVKTVG
ncbi:hypothetical protein DDE83_004553 [Stemphylium lycopersici]|uniref:Uncharacterized protein n=1 Tax=Stemphylium lycopersici TaxID=183478 RepID=A0A364N489_STELY|nr:hypothetical protein DDE83_004553 [Stemphylium lycopersici]